MFPNGERKVSTVACQEAEGYDWCVSNMSATNLRIFAILLLASFLLLLLLLLTFGMKGCKAHHQS